jgi:hypothetical protein
MTVSGDVPYSAPFGTDVTLTVTAGASPNPVVFSSSGDCTNVDGVYTMSSTEGSCTATVTQAGDATYFASPTLTYYIAVTKFPQAISVTTEPPATARFHSSFTVVATGGGSGQAVTFGSSGGCTNIAGVFTMTSSTDSCFVTVDQAGNATYSAAPQASYEVVADLGLQTPITLKPSVAKGKYLKIAKATLEGGAVSVKASGACTVAKVFKGTGAKKKLNYFKVTGTKRGQKCKVKISAGALADYEALPPYTVTVKVK